MMPINISIDHFIVPRLFFTLITCCYSYIIFFELLKMGQTLAEKIRQNYVQQFSKITEYTAAKPAAEQSVKSQQHLSILHTVEFYHPHTGGAETVVQQISERLAKRGHRVEVATTKLPGRDFRELNGVTIHEFDISGNLAHGIRGSDIQRYKEFLMKQPADVMMNYAAQQWATDLAYSVLEPTRGKRVNVIAPCGYSALKDARTIRWPEFTGYFQKIIPYAVPLYDAAVYHSAVYKDYEFAQLHGFQNSVVIPNGVDEEEFSAESEIDFRNKYEIKTKYMGLCVGNFFSGKGQDRVIESVRQMNRGDFTAVLIGKQGDQLDSLKRQAAGLPVKFLVDIPRKDTVAAFHVADIFLFGSYIEASPLVILEAKASRTPFVSTDCGNVREWKGGIVCSPDEMSEHVNKLLNNETLRNRLAEEGFNEWKEKLTWDAVVDQYEDLYLRLHHAKKKKKSVKVPLKLSKKRASKENEEAALLEKLQKDPRHVPSLVRLAEIEQKRSNHKKAQKYILAALALEPKNRAAKTMWEKLHR